MSATDANYGTTLAERVQNPVSQWRQALHVYGRRLRVALPGWVVDFDATKQTVNVQPAVTEIERVAGVLTPRALPVLVDVPVVLPRAGGYTLTLPVQPGDECLVVFGDTCMDAWWQSGAGGENQDQPQNEVEQRRHTLADGFAILGPWSQPRVLANYSTSSAQLRNDAGTTVIDVAQNQVTVTAQTAQINTSGNATVNASGTATVEGNTVNITGSSNVTIGSNVKIDNRVFLQHTHSGVQTGSGVSGPVV